MTDKRYTAEEAYEYWMTGDRHRPPFRVMLLQPGVERVVQAVEDAESITFTVDVIGVDPDGTKVRAHFVEELQMLYVRMPDDT